MDEKDAVSSFLNEVTEPRDIFKEEPKDEEVVVEGDAEEKPLPFHQDPKVQRYIEKQVSKALEGVTPREKVQETVATPSDVKDVIGAFTAIIGNDTPEKVQALAALEKTLTGADERASKKAIERFQQQQEEVAQKQVEADKKAKEELDAYFDEIEETYSVDLSSNSATAKQLRTQFIEYVRKIAPKDANGEVAAFPDLVSSFEEFQEKNKRAPAVRAKELANRGLTRSGDANAVPKLVSGQGDPWRQVEQHFNKLKANT